MRALPGAGREAASRALASLGTFVFHLPRGRRRRSGARSSRRTTGGDLAWFTRAEGAAVEALAETILPSGHGSPGASDVRGGARSLTHRIDEGITADAARQAVYARGLLALDEQAHRSHGASFAELPPDARAGLLREVELLRASRRGSSPASKILGKGRTLLGYLDGWPAVADLLPVVISDTHAAFYTTDVAWRWLGYDGPPMPLGYPSPTQERDPDGPLDPESASPSALSTPADPPTRGGEPGPAGPTTDASARRDAADVVVIGSGAGGAVAARELAEAGLSVVVLEAGPRFVPEADYPTHRADFELRGRGTFAPPDPRRDIYTTAGSHGFAYSRVKGVGGSTLHYQGVSPRLHESDFRVRSLDGVADDWPIAYPDLEPYYTRVEYVLGVSGPDGANPFEPPRSRPYPNPAHPFNLAGMRVKRGADALGLHMVREPLALPSRPWGGRPACNGAGTCSLGCRIGAKSSMDVTYVRAAEATGKAEIRSGCTACEIEVDREGRASGVAYFDRDGSERRVSARAVVVAGNAIETARLLLMSTSSRFPDGLANSSGLVGRNFMEHLDVFAFGLFDERTDPWRGTPTSGMLQDYYETDPSRGFARGWTILVTAYSHWPVAMARGLSGWGEDHKRSMQERFGHSLCIATVGEQLPDERNRVALDPLKKDSFGLPAPLLINQPRENDRAMIRAMKEHQKTLLEASGAREISGNDHAPGMSSHYLGTCRMGDDPERSVVDAWCRAHDVPNLFIADGSVMVTGGAANPALTISALAARTSDGIVERFRRGEL